MRHSDLTIEWKFTLGREKYAYEAMYQTPSHKQAVSK